MLTVDAETQVRGRLVAAGCVRLETWFEGDIVCSRLEIGPDGYICGTVAAHEVIVEGQIVGPVHASVVHLFGGSFVEGDIHHTVLKMEPGATLTGRSSRFKAIQLPAELLALEAKADADRSALEHAERSSIPGAPPLALVETRAKSTRRRGAASRT
jgi:cytoskeletal protein CcmA (bactofilin family)